LLSTIDLIKPAQLQNLSQTQESSYVLENMITYISLERNQKGRMHCDHLQNAYMAKIINSGGNENNSRNKAD
jgi:hypothetical protein